MMVSMDRTEAEQGAKMDARIGVLNSGRFYAFANGYHAEPVMGTLEEVEMALGLRAAPVAIAARIEVKPAPVFKRFNVLLTFQYPAWDEVDGIPYDDIPATSKRNAIKSARRQAERDGHAVSGRGRYYFTATEA